jgi:hypothetical protein
MKVAGLSPGDALGASGQLNKVEPPSDGQVTATPAPLACVSCKSLGFGPARPTVSSSTTQRWSDIKSCPAVFTTNSANLGQESWSTITAEPLTNYQ